MWGTNEVEWVENGNDNGVGGVITMWRKIAFIQAILLMGVIIVLLRGNGG